MNLLNPWVILGIILLCAALFFGGVKVESDHRDAQLLTQERAFHAAFVNRAGELRANADTVSADLNLARKGRAADRLEFSTKLLEAIHGKELSRVTCPIPGEPAGAPVVLVNASLWDAALTIGRGPGSDTGRADGGARPPDFAPLEEAYANLGENSNRWSACRAQVSGWQSLARKNGWVK